jgi:hypothetical protein
MAHRHYKGLATKAESEKWFNIQPATSANIIPPAAVSGRQAQLPATTD